MKMKMARMLLLLRLVATVPLVVGAGLAGRSQAQVYGEGRNLAVSILVEVPRPTVVHAQQGTLVVWPRT